VSLIILSQDELMFRSITTFPRS